MPQWFFSPRLFVALISPTPTPLHLAAPPAEHCNPHSTVGILPSSVGGKIHHEARAFDGIRFYNLPTTYATTAGGNEERSEQKQSPTAQLATSIAWHACAKQARKAHLARVPPFAPWCGLGRHPSTIQLQIHRQRYILARRRPIGFVHLQGLEQAVFSAGKRARDSGDMAGGVERRYCCRCC